MGRSLEKGQKQMCVPYGKYVRVKNTLINAKTGLKLSTSENHPCLCIEADERGSRLIVLTTAPGLNVEDFVNVGPILDKQKNSYANLKGIFWCTKQDESGFESRPKNLVAGADMSKVIETLEENGVTFG